MLLAVVRLGLVVITASVAGAHSPCLFPRSCPCGASGKNYTRCYDIVIEQYSCERWINCQTCEDNYEFCVTCPKGRSGPTCKESACPLLKRPRNGRVKCIGGYRFCSISCLSGFRFENRKTSEEIILKCEQNAWIPHQNIPDCKPTGELCGLQGTGNYNCQSDLDGVHCDITCNGKLEGKYHCYPGKGWNSSLPSCTSPEGVALPEAKTVTCPDPGRPTNGGRMDIKGNAIPSQHTFTEGEAVIYFCKGKNGTFGRTTFLTCQSDATWSRKPPVCSASQKKVRVQSKSSCQHPGVVENGFVVDLESDAEQFPAGTTLRFVCREGFQRRGPEAIYCLSNLTWSEAPPVCTALPTSAQPPVSQPSCKHPGTVKNGFIVDEVADQSFPPGSSLRFQCNAGHEMVGADTIYCRFSVAQRADWSGDPPICKHIARATTKFCKNPGKIQNGIIENASPDREHFLAGTALKFRCRDGYQLEGPENMYCWSNGKWSQDPPTCRYISATTDSAVSCKHPGMVESGRFDGDLTKSSFPVGTKLLFHCNVGTRREGPMLIVCLDNGKWSGIPTCNPLIDPRKAPEQVMDLPCKHPGPIENGAVEMSSTETGVYLEGDEIQFKCREGYSLEGPDTLHCLNTGEWTLDPPTCRPMKKTADCGRVYQVRTGQYRRSDWPWTVGISTVSEDDVEKMFCGGALLNKETVLTAAHCATSNRNINLHFGHLARSSNGVRQAEQVRNIQISQIIIHPEYDDRTHDNDIAVMKLEPRIFYDRGTQPVCLPTQTLDGSAENLFPGNKAIVTGYGLHFAANHSSTARFMKLEFPLQNEKVCNDVCRRQGLVTCSPSTFCAGYAENADECVYGGSPLVVYHPEKGRYTLEGLVTRAESTRNRWNGRCKRPEGYATFTNVTNFMPFILEHLH